MLALLVPPANAANVRCCTLFCGAAAWALLPDTSLMHKPSEASSRGHQVGMGQRADLAPPAPRQDLIRRLLTALPSARLGSLPGGARDIFVHPFFAGFPWEDLLQGAHRACASWGCCHSNGA